MEKRKPGKPKGEPTKTVSFRFAVSTTDTVNKYCLWLRQNRKQLGRNRMKQFTLNKKVERFILAEIKANSKKINQILSENQKNY